MSHVYAFDVPHHPKPLFITDAAVNIAPSLDDKRDIVQNAIDLCHALGIPQPKIAILSAVETVDAAALCKMAERGQIAGAIVDGPLALDNAVSRPAAAAKHIVSRVAGDADVLVVPDLVSGNMLAKQLVHLAGAEAAGLVLGATVPIVVTSRSIARRPGWPLAPWRASLRTTAGPGLEPSIVSRTGLDPDHGLPRQALHSNDMPARPARASLMTRAEESSVQRRTRCPHPSRRPTRSTEAASSLRWKSGAAC